MPEKSRLNDINEEFLKRGAGDVTEKNLNEVRDKSDEIRSKFESGGPLGRFIEDAKLFLSLIRDYMKGEYRRIPWWAISAVVFTLLYVFNPFDIVPDLLPVVGYVDDAAVFVLCLALVEQQLREYKEWKTKLS
ncbi:MAG TPA: YkvA family protein [Bacteroidota bacterium]|nr:YkvA family protein [Bacteroidota bacterium]